MFNQDNVEYNISSKLVNTVATFAGFGAAKFPSPVNRVYVVERQNCAFVKTTLEVYNTYPALAKTTCGNGLYWIIDIYQPNMNMQKLGCVQGNNVDFSGPNCAASVNAVFRLLENFVIPSFDWGGNYRCDASLTIEKLKTTNISGDLYLWALIDLPLYGAYFKDLSNYSLAGTFTFECLGGAEYALRKTPFAILFGNISRANIQMLAGINAQIGGVAGPYPTNNGAYNANLANVGTFRGEKCGSGWAVDSKKGTVYAVVRYGNAGSTSQFSAVSLNSFAELPPLALNEILSGLGSVNLTEPSMVSTYSDVYIKFDSDGDLYTIGHIDRASGKVFVNGFVPDSRVGQTFTYMFGGAFIVTGADGNIMNVGKVEGTNCFLTANLNGFYGCNIGEIHSDACYAGYAVGSRVGSYIGGSNVGVTYWEGVTKHIIVNNNCDLFLANNSGFDLKTVVFCGYARDPITGAKIKTSPSISNMIINDKGFQFKKVGNPQNYNNNEEVLLMGMESQTQFHKDSQTFILTPVDGLNDFTGAQGNVITISGTGADGQPTGDIKFKTVVGKTVNGAVDVTFNGLTRPTQFKYYYVTGNDIKVWKL